MNTSLVVGACLAGADGSFRHHFNGYLAGLSLINGAIEREEVIRCLVQCKENIGVAADLNELDTLTIRTSDTDDRVAAVDQTTESNLNARLGRILKRMSSNAQESNDENDDYELQMNILQNQDGQQLLIEGRSIIQLEEALSQIYYRNDREYPTPGRRGVRVSTNIRFVFF